MKYRARLQALERLLHVKPEPRMFIATHTLDGYTVSLDGESVPMSPAQWSAWHATLDPIDLVLVLNARLDEPNDKPSDERATYRM